MSTADLFDLHADLVRDLRNVSAAPSPEVRARVRALGEPERRAVRRLPLRRLLVVAVPASAVALLAAAVVHGLRSPAATPVPETARSVPGLKSAPTATVDTVEPIVSAQQAHGSAASPAPAAGRKQDYEAELQVRVQDLDAVGRQTAAAMRVTSDLGGYVASVQQTTAGGASGEADLVLRVPVAKVETAIERLSALGTVVAEHVSIVDLEQTVQAQRTRIRALRVRIVRLRAALRQSLPADVRLRIQFQLADARDALERVSGAHESTLREAALSRISLTLATEAAVPVAHKRGRIGAAASSALDFLAGAGAVAVLVLIVISPLVLLAALAWYGVRTWRRREERRLLAGA
jgi:hypothetical protein